MATFQCPFAALYRPYFKSASIKTFTPTWPVKFSENVVNVARIFHNGQVIWTWKIKRYKGHTYEQRTRHADSEELSARRQYVAGIHNSRAVAFR